VVSLKWSPVDRVGLGLQSQGSVELSGIGDDTLSHSLKFLRSSSLGVVSSEAWDEEELFARRTTLRQVSKYSRVLAVSKTKVTNFLSWKTRVAQHSSRNALCVARIFPTMASVGVHTHSIVRRAIVRCTLRSCKTKCVRPESIQASAIRVRPSSKRTPTQIPFISERLKHRKQTCRPCQLCSLCSLDSWPRSLGAPFGVALGVVPPTLFRMLSNSLGTFRAASPLAVDRMEATAAQPALWSPGGVSYRRRGGQTTFKAASSFSLQLQHTPSSDLYNKAISTRLHQCTNSKRRLETVLNLTAN